MMPGSSSMIAEACNGLTGIPTAHIGNAAKRLLRPLSSLCKSKARDLKVTADVLRHHCRCRNMYVVLREGIEGLTQASTFTPLT